jgi:hypothetical protein
MNADQWIAQFSIAYAAKGAALSHPARGFLLSPLPEEPTLVQIETGEEAKQMMTALLFQRATRGSLFGDIGRVRQEFGRTLEENYGLSSGPFLALARAFWTFKIELNDLLPDESGLFLTQILMLIEEEVASVFFPTPGPAVIPVEKRREGQRLYLSEYAPTLDVQRFLSENPILKIEARRQKRGCLGFALATAAAVAGLGWLVANVGW